MFNSNSLGYERSPYSATTVDANTVQAVNVNATTMNKGVLIGAYGAGPSATGAGTLTAAFFQQGRIQQILTGNATWTTDTAVLLQTALRFVVGQSITLKISHAGNFTLSPLPGAGVTLFSSTGGTPVYNAAAASPTFFTEELELICTNAGTSSGYVGAAFTLFVRALNGIVP